MIPFLIAFGLGIIVGFLLGCVLACMGDATCEDEPIELWP